MCSTTWRSNDQSFATVRPPTPCKYTEAVPCNLKFLSARWSTWDSKSCCILFTNEWPKIRTVRTLADMKMTIKQEKTKQLKCVSVWKMRETYKKADTTRSQKNAMTTKKDIKTKQPKQTGHVPSIKWTMKKPLLLPASNQNEWHNSGWQLPMSRTPIGGVNLLNTLWPLGISRMCHEISNVQFTTNDNQEKA